MNLILRYLNPPRIPGVTIRPHLLGDVHQACRHAAYEEAGLTYDQPAARRVYFRAMFVADPALSYAERLLRTEPPKSSTPSEPPALTVFTKEKELTK